MASAAAVAASPIAFKFGREQLLSSPSSADGLTMNEQLQQHLEATRLIRLVALRLRLPVLTTATAHVYYQLFFAARSLTKFDPLNVATAALFTACKAEDTPKRAKEVCGYSLLIRPTLQRSMTMPSPQPDGFSSGQSTYATPPDTSDDGKVFSSINSKDAAGLREQIVRIEKEMLDVVGFEFDVPHGFALLVLLCKRLGIDKRRAQGAWQTLFDSYGTTLYLQFDIATMAVGAITLATKSAINSWWAPVAPSVSSAHVKDFIDQMAAYYQFCSTVAPGAEVPSPVHSV